MKRVRIYTTRWCGFCVRAKKLLKDNGVDFEEIDVQGDEATRAWLREASGQSTVPQIFFDDESVGGCSDLEALIRAGTLEARLGR